MRILFAFLLPITVSAAGARRSACGVAGLVRATLKP
jgi:hypothetical protein